MSPQWLPQNIQKRLLLYVLQQLSLFSEIDLPNLEQVSLNNIHLKNVSIDPEKVGTILPGCNLRYGQVGSLELNGGVMDGVTVEASDVDMVIAFNLNLNIDLDHDISKSVQFSLAQSTQDLANTIMLGQSSVLNESLAESLSKLSEEEGKGVLDEFKEDTQKGDKIDGNDREDRDGRGSSSSSSSSTPSKPSALTGVVGKAVELALSRLQVKVRNVNIKLITESAELVVKVDSVGFNTVNGVRSVSVGGVSVVSLDGVSGGDTEEEERKHTKNAEDTAENDTDGKEGDKDDSTASGSGSDSEPDSDDDKYGEPSLMDSMVFTHEEASSIYMSATSSSFKANQKEAKPKLSESSSHKDAVIIYLNEMMVEFEGLGQISNLCVGLDTLKISCSPLVPTILSIVNGITKGLKLNVYHRRKEVNKANHYKPNTRFPQYHQQSDELDENEDDDPEDPEDPEDTTFFNKLSVSEVQLSLTSALLPNGDLSSPKNNLFVKLTNCNVKQKHGTLVYGGIESFTVIRTVDGVQTPIFTFVESEEEQAKADIRFELFSKISSDFKINEFTTLLSKPCVIDLDPYVIHELSEFIEGISHVSTGLKGLFSTLEVYRSLTVEPVVKKDTLDNHIIFQTSHIDVNINLDEATTVKVQILPISMNSLNNEMKCQRILVDTEMSLKDELIRHRIASISNLLLSTKLRDFKSFINHSNLFARGINLSSSVNFLVSKINMEVPFVVLKGLISSITTTQEFLSRQHKRYDRPSQNMSSTINSTYNPKKFRKRINIMPNSIKNIIDFDFHFEEINFTVIDVSKQFGDIIGRITNANIFKFNDDFNLVVKGVKLNRVCNDINDKFVYYYDEKKDNQGSIGHNDPIIIGQVKGNGSVELKLQKMVIEVYGVWQKLFEKDLEEIEERLDQKTNIRIDDKLKGIRTGDNLEETSGNGGESNRKVNKDISDKKKKSATFDPNSNTSVSHVTAVPVTYNKKLDIRIQFKDCLIGITPIQLTCKAYLNIHQMSSDVILNSDQVYVKTTIRDLTILLIDDLTELKPINHQKFKLLHMTPLTYFLNRGFLNVGNINNLHIGITYNFDEDKLVQRYKYKNMYNKLSLLDIKMNIDEINLETCGDSFFTLTQLINDLKIPVILRDQEKFKTELKEPLNVLNGIGPFEFGPTTTSNDHQTAQDAQTEDDSFDFVEEYHNHSDNELLNDSIEDEFIEATNSLNLDENYFNKPLDHHHIKINPISVNINLGKVNLYMYDGYDWKETRKVIKGVIKRVEQESLEDTEASTHSPQQNEGSDSDSDGSDEDLEVIQETLFQSIHVTLPKGINPSVLTSNINKQVNENEHEGDGHPESVSVTYKDLKLRRSNKYKILIELKNIDINVIIHTLRDPLKDASSSQTFEMVNEIEIVVDLFTVYDNLINSTWNKYLSYMSSMGEKEIGQNMLKMSLITIRDPVDLNFNETVAKLTLLPVRLFIDQDTNEFLVRFFKFTDERFKVPRLEEDVYFKKFEISKDFKIKVDYKPKKINLIGLKNGEFNELLNLININGLTVNLNKIKVYGLKGMDKLFMRLFEHWLPNIQKTQLLNLFNGIELFKPIINISESFKNLISIPITDFNHLNDQLFYKKLNKSGKEFLKTTSFELLKLGYKLTNGTQTLLEQGEEILGGTGSKSRSITSQKKKTVKLESPIEEEDSLLENSIRLNKSSQPDHDTSIYSSMKKKYSEIDEGEDLEYGEGDDESIEDAKVISLYSNQPQNFKQGVKLSYKSINKNYKLTKQELLGLIEKLNETNNYEESMKILLKKSPLLVLRPMIGTTEIVSKALMGLSNEISSTDLNESRDKYKNHS